MSRQRIRQVVGNLEERTERAVRIAAIEVTAELQEATPVQFGWARANYVPSLRVPSINPAARNVAGDQRRGLVGSAQARQQQGLASILGFKISDQQVFVTNNVPYLRKLNEGSSRQAPAGFIEDAIRRGVQNASRKI